MKLDLAIVTVIVAGTAATAGSAVGQTRPGAAPANAAVATTHMKSLGYKDIHDLRRAPNGQWVGKATRNGVERTVTVRPNGATTAR